MKRDRIDELAAELFAAAREEGPDRGLVARVQREADNVAPMARDEDGAAGRARGPASQRRAARGRFILAPAAGRWLLAALVTAAVGALLLMPRAQEAVMISAEGRPGVTPGSAGMAGGARAADVPSAPVGPVPEPPLPETLLPETLLPETRHPEVAAPESLRSEPARAVEPTIRSGEAKRSPQPARATPPREPAPNAANAPSGPSSASEPSAPVAAPAATPSLSSELGVLKQIRQALRGRDGAGALVLLDRYDTGEYGKSLSLEASVLRVEALDAVGRRREAETLARRFVRDNPDSPLAERAQSFIHGADPARTRESAAP
ncbi:MAG TPA: hypothetical protein VMG12_25935 [Polyangiaceae bacterium]|nr:hypothetical protein [Polyangiaceae bacterium]